MESLKMEEIIIILKNEISQSIHLINTIPNDFGIGVSPQYVRPVIEALIHQFKIYHLSAITGQQWVKEPSQIELIYHFWNGKGLSIHTILKRDNPQIPSIIDIIPGADFYEREVSEMYGVRFVNRPNMPPLLLPDDWQGVPPMLLLENEDEQN
jgi:NADH-quinone oxidoreductase subunit C